MSTLQPPTFYLSRQVGLCRHTNRLLIKAKEAQRLVEEDLDRQMQSFVKYHKRQPTLEEQADADWKAKRDLEIGSSFAAVKDYEELDTKNISKKEVEDE